MWQRGAMTIRVKADGRAALVVADRELPGNLLLTIPAADIAATLSWHMLSIARLARRSLQASDSPSAEPGVHEPDVAGNP
jgi:hypothetical protein